jgi:hypothetical protein
MPIRRKWLLDVSANRAILPACAVDTPNTFRPRQMAAAKHD